MLHQQVGLPCLASAIVIELAVQHLPLSVVCQRSVYSLNHIACVVLTELLLHLLGKLSALDHTDLFTQHCTWSVGQARMLSTA